MDIETMTLADLKAHRPDLAAALREEGSTGERRRLSGAKTDVEAKWAADWAASAKLQDEYLTAAAYVATMRRQARTA